MSCKLDKQITFIESQPFSISFNSYNNEKDRTYTPDYYIRRDLGLKPSQFTLSTAASEIIIEVKRIADLKYLSDRDVERLAAAAVWAMQSDERDFLIITDGFFTSEKGETIRLLAGFVEVPITSAAQALLDILNRSSPIEVNTAYELLTIAGYSLAEAEEAMLLSMANGWLETETFKIPSESDKLYWRDVDENPDPET